ncbi:PAS domain S-box-containing protein [Modestobacter sp. DSM 44400]|nr:PAS domain S-box-containing protein [Modestobacter sp. DSM 44400]
MRAVTSYFLADGSERTVDFTLQLVHDQETGRDYLFPNGMDVTDRVAAQWTAAQAAAATAQAEVLQQAADARAADVAALRAVEAELSRALELSAKVLDNTADGIYGLDAAGRVEFVNPAAVRITGHARDEQLGSDQHSLIHGRRADGSDYPLEQCPVWQALQTGRTVVADDEVYWRADGRPVPVELVAVPTVEDGEVTGVVVSFRDLTARLAAEAQTAELRRLEQQAAEQRALSDRLQQALLTPPPEPDHLHVVVRYQPAAHHAQVGGDWYDAFLQPDGATMLVIGDVVGHDSSAAASMGQLRGLMRALAYDNDESLEATLTRVEHAARGLAVETLATALLARIERCPDVPVTGTRTLRWTSAGHLPPVLLQADGTSAVLETPVDLMLGVDPDAPRRSHETELPNGSTLLLFTDGLVERRSGDLDEGVERLRAALTDLGTRPLDELCDLLLARLVPASGDDDVALLAVRAYPEDRPRPPEAGPNVLPPGIG